MRVLHVVKKFPPLIGGDATAVAGLARAQQNAGDEVMILTHRPRGPDAMPSANDGGVHRVGPAESSADLDRIGWRRIRGLAAIRRWAKRKLAEIRPDVVHAHAADVGFAVASVAREGSVPSLLTCHGVWFPTRGRHSVLGSVEVRLMRLGRYRAITAVDPASVAALASAGFPDARVVPNGVDPEEFAGERRADGPFRFLFAGRHEPQKGLDVLLDATERLRSSARVPFAVDIAGEGALTSRLRLRAKELGLEGIVRFPGSLQRKDLVAAFLRADAFVLPSRSEGFPITILEAWAARLPVIATTVGGVPSVCTTDNARLVPPEDAGALAEAMSGLLDDPGERTRLAEQGHRLARERFSWDAIVRDYREIYAHIG